MQYCYLNGQIIPEQDARVGVLDIGLLRGYGIYEAMAVVNGKIFRWENHIERFRKSADFLHIQIPLSDSELGAVIFDLIEKNALPPESKGRVNVKCILTGGTSIGGIDFDGSKPTFYIFLEEWKPLDAHYHTDGASLIMHEHLRQYPEYKTTNYIAATSLQKNMKDAGALEILYTWKDTVLECATSNFFIIRNNILITAQENILKGVTRNVVVELARKNGFTVEERPYGLSELWAANEAFLTSSFKDVVPVVMVDGKTIGDGKVGASAKNVMRLFDEYLQTY